MGFSGIVLSWLRSYLDGRRQCVRVGDRSSEWKPVTCGVPQGSILGPLLLSLYINDISSSLLFTKFHCYADDLQIYAHCKVTDINKTVENINADITRIVAWAKRHGLTLNPDKTKSIVMGHSRLLSTINMDTVQSIVMNDTVVPYCSSVKSFGLTINSTLDWTSQVVYTCNRVFAAVHSLKKMQRLLPFHIKETLIKSLVFPYCHYCNSVINDMTVALSTKLQRSQNYCVRFLYNLRRDKRITPYYVRLSMLKLSNRRAIRILTLLHSILHNKQHQYFVNDFKFIIGEGSARVSRSGSSKLRSPHHRTEVYN